MRGAARVLLLIGASAVPTTLAEANEEQLPPFLVIGMGPGSEQPDAPILLQKQLGADARAPVSGPIRWHSVAGRPIPPGEAAPPGGVRLVPVEPGTVSIPLTSGARNITVLRASIRLPSGDAASTVAISRGLPEELRLPGTVAPGDESFRLVFAARGTEGPATLDLVSVGPFGAYLDKQKGLELAPVPCPSGGTPDPEIRCLGTPVLRLAADSVERNHPAVAGRTLLGEVGGTVTVELGARPVHRLRIAAPHALGPDGPGRYSVKLRARIVRTFSAGPPAVGADETEAVRIVREEIASASRMWGQCGIHFGDPTSLDIQVVDPPRLALLSVGCDGAAQASGGTIALDVGQRRVSLRTQPGQSAAAVASRLSQAIRAAGFVVEQFRNATISRAAGSSFDLVVTDRGGRPVSIGPQKAGRISDDPSLGVCVGDLNLADGLEHFSDENAAAGTVEERILLRALSDADPSTIELIVVPVFGGIGRIGESFIRTQGGSVENALILDRTGIRAGARSFTLAHELGHILLDLPGHPDDFGVDTPTSLMDADAADPTIFGPRRLSLEDCQRALRQSGPGSPTELIFAWPLEGASPAKK